MDELCFIQALEGDLKRLQHLLEKKGVPPDLLDSAGYTALHYACRAGHLEIVSYLISSGADVNKPTRANLSTPLHKAALAGRSACVHYLLGHGANPNPKDAAGHSPLHYATEAGHKDVVQQLISRGALT